MGLGVVDSEILKNRKFTLCDQNDIISYYYYYLIRHVHARPVLIILGKTLRKNYKERKYLY